MSWNHRMCGDCWLGQHLKYLPDGGVEFKVPVMMKGMPPSRCCFCVNTSVLGILVRHDPNSLDCTHKDETETK